MARVLIWISLGLVSLNAAFAGSLSPFVFVMIDAQTEAIYGTLPFNRTVIATAVDRLTGAKVKGIVIKVFYDLRSTEENDHSLEQSICGATVALQASLNDDEGTTNGLESKFQVFGPPIRNFRLFLSATKLSFPCNGSVAALRPWGLLTRRLEHFHSWRCIKVK